MVYIWCDVYFINIHNVHLCDWSISTYWTRLCMRLCFDPWPSRLWSLWLQKWPCSLSADNAVDVFCVSLSLLRMRVHQRHCLRHFAQSEMHCRPTVTRWTMRIFGRRRNSPFHLSLHQIQRGLSVIHRLNGELCVDECIHQVAKSDWRDFVMNLIVTEKLDNYATSCWMLRGDLIIILVMEL